MHAVAELTAITPETLLAMPDEKDFELVKGELVERNMGSMSSWVGGRIYRLVSDYCEAHALGFVWPADPAGQGIAAKGGRVLALKVVGRGPLTQ